MCIHRVLLWRSLPSNQFEWTIGLELNCGFERFSIQKKLSTKLVWLVGMDCGNGKIHMLKVADIVHVYVKMLVYWKRMLELAELELCSDLPGLMPHNRWNPSGQIVPLISKYCSLHIPLSGLSISVSTKSTLICNCQRRNQRAKNCENAMGYHAYFRLVLEKAKVAGTCSNIMPWVMWVNEINEHFIAL